MFLEGERNSSHSVDPIDFTFEFLNENWKLIALCIVMYMYEKNMTILAKQGWI